jgi:hypothetical protein
MIPAVHLKQTNKKKARQFALLHFRLCSGGQGASVVTLSPCHRKSFRGSVRSNPARQKSANDHSFSFSRSFNTLFLK